MASWELFLHKVSVECPNHTVEHYCYPYFVETETQAQREKPSQWFTSYVCWSQEPDFSAWVLGSALLLMEGRMRYEYRSEIRCLRHLSEVRSVFERIHHTSSSCTEDVLPKGQYEENEPHTEIRKETLPRWEERVVEGIIRCRATNTTEWMKERNSSRLQYTWLQGHREPAYGKKEVKWISTEQHNGRKTRFQELNIVLEKGGREVISKGMQN